MFAYGRILVLCSFAGYLFAAAFMAPGGATEGAVKGLLVGLLVVWGEWKSKHAPSVGMGRSEPL